MLYQAYEFGHATVVPWRQVVLAAEVVFSHPGSPLAYSPARGYVTAGCRVFNELTRRYGKPEFHIDRTDVGGVPVPVREQVVRSLPFANLVRFERVGADDAERHDPKILIVAPMSGHHATLLRDTVRAMLPEHRTYITDWRDARSVPVLAGTFGVDDYVSHLLECLRAMGPGAHVLAVCQPAPLALVATAHLAMTGSALVPRSLTLMAGPIDTRVNPTVVNEHARGHELEWFRGRVITRVPFPHPGACRSVYPGFLQLAGFMAMNLDRHVEAFRDYFDRLAQGDRGSVKQHRRFYDEYLSVMDLDARFFIETVQRFFKEDWLPRGLMRFRGRRIDLTSVTNTALCTIEGGLDDICGVGQTEAAHGLCPAIPDALRYHHLQPDVGHYGVFHGSRWRQEIQPRIRDVIRAAEDRAAGS